jgi:hypothetical protein
MDAPAGEFSAADSWKNDLGTTRARCNRGLAAVMSHSPIDYMSMNYVL